jgi:hypothetical protein
MTSRLTKTADHAGIDARDFDTCLFFKEYILIKEVFMPRFTQQESDAVKRLIPYAERKDFVADLILNGYDGNCPVSMRRVMRYAAGETSNSTYRDDVFVVLGLMERGVETHEVIGSKTIDRLREIWR